MYIPEPFDIFLLKLSIVLMVFIVYFTFLFVPILSNSPKGSFLHRHFYEVMTLHMVVFLTTLFVWTRFF